MKNGTGKKREQYRRILKRLPRLYECSEHAYRDYMKGRPKGQEEAWAAAYCYGFLPSAFLYVLWVLAHALGCGKRRLYFLSGESYLIYLIAWHICEQWQFPLECRYLYLPGEAGVRTCRGFRQSMSAGRERRKGKSGDRKICRKEIRSKSLQEEKLIG